MKTMTCRELGGTCDQKLSASTWDEMVKAMTKHVIEKHRMWQNKWKKCTTKTQKWGKEMRPKWEAARDV